MTGSDEACAMPFSSPPPSIFARCRGLTTAAQSRAGRTAVLIRPCQFEHLLHKQALVAAEARDHGSEKSLRLQPIEIQRVAGAMGNERQKRSLRSSISFAERMNSVQGRKERRSRDGEAFS